MDEEMTMRERESDGESESEMTVGRRIRRPRVGSTLQWVEVGGRKAGIVAVLPATHFTATRRLTFRPLLPILVLEPAELEAPNPLPSPDSANHISSELRLTFAEQALL